MRCANRLLAMIAVLPLAACPDEKPVDLSAAKASARHELPAPAAARPQPRPTMPDGPLPFRIPTTNGAATLAFAPELVIYDHKILRKPTSPSNTYAGTAVDYAPPASISPFHVIGRLDDSAGDIALFVNDDSSANETLLLLDDLKLSRVAFAVDANGERGQLGYLFGTADPSVRDRLELELAYGDLLMGETSVANPGALAKIAKEQHAQSSVGITARIGVRTGTTNQQLAAVLSALASAGIESVQLYRSQDPEAPSSSAVSERNGSVPIVRIGQPNAQGDLDKAIIRRYIKRNIQKIQYCYEKALLNRPDLAGTVNTQFFITPTGKVSMASGSGGEMAAVGSCVANVIKAIEFPKPKGGGGVQVNYPFTFALAGF